MARDKNSSLAISIFLIVFSFLYTPILIGGMENTNRKELENTPFYLSLLQIPERYLGKGSGCYFSKGILQILFTLKKK